MKTPRTRLCHELLESRNLLAGDVGFSPWTQPIHPNDTNGDGVVTAVDALIVINQLNRSDTSELADISAPPILGLDQDSPSASFHLDSSGDGLVTALDSLLVINELNDPGRATALGESSESTDAAISQLSAEGESTTLTIAFRNHFGRLSGTLSADNLADTYRFVATMPRVTIDLNSDAREDIAVVRVFDSRMSLVAVSSDHATRERFEGFDVVTRAGQEYFITVEYSDPDADVPPEFPYALSVFQFDPSRWLPNTADEVITVGGEEDLPDTIADAISVPIRPIGSSFSQRLDSPTDVDVIRLPNGLPGSVFVSGLEGIAFELLDRSGDALVRNGFELDKSRFPDSDIGYFEGDLESSIGDDSVYLRIFSTNGAVGDYNVSVLFENNPDGPPSTGGPSTGGPADNFTPYELQFYDPETASPIRFVDGQATISGTITATDPRQFFRFSTGDLENADRVRLEIIGGGAASDTIEFQIFDATNGRALITGVNNTDNSVFLPGRLSGEDIEMVVAVRDRFGPSDFSLNVELISLPVSPETIDAEVLGTAQPLPEPEELTIQRFLPIAADSVALYRLTAIDTRTVFLIASSPENPFSKITQLEIAFYDSSGRRFPPTFFADGELDFDAYQTLLDRFQVHAVFADTEIGEEIYLRIGNPFAESLNLDTRGLAIQR